MGCRDRTELGVRLDDHWVGMLGLHRLERGGEAEIGYWMAAAARGHGYLTEAARAVIDFAFDPDGLALERMEWRAVVGNVPSARSARTLGFRYEGLFARASPAPRGRDDGWIAALLPRMIGCRSPGRSWTTDARSMVRVNGWHP